MGHDRIEQLDRAWKGGSSSRLLSVIADGSPTASTGFPTGRRFTRPPAYSTTITEPRPAELISKLAWAVGSTFGQPYASNRSRIRIWAVQMASRLIEAWEKEKGDPKITPHP